MSRSKPPIVALVVIVIAVCVAQVARMTRDGTPFGVAITTVALFAVGVAGGTWVVLIFLGRRNRTLLRHVRARQASNAFYPVFFGRELQEALRARHHGEEPPVPWSKHAVLEIGENDLTIWATAARGNVVPVLLGRFEQGQVVAVEETEIQIEGSGHQGIVIELESDGAGVSELPVGVASRAFGAFFPSRRARRVCANDLRRLMGTESPSVPQ